MNTPELELFAKTSGMSAAAGANLKWLRMAQEAALLIGRQKDTVSVNDVHEAIPELPSGCYLGSTFKWKSWIFTGRYKKARHKNSHARDVKIWELLK